MPRKLAIVTGGTAGLGLETSKELAKLGYDLVITGRSSTKAVEARASIISQAPAAEVIWYQLDQSDLNEIVDFCDWIGERKWNLLVNNAGAKIERPHKLTRQGFEWHIGVNHLSHLFLTQLLVSKAQPAARVVFVSSIVAAGARFETDIDYSICTPSVAYRDSKLGNLVSAIKIGELLSENGSDITVTAAHPGFAKASSYGTRFTRFAEAILAQSASRGAQTIVAACFAPAGSYIAPRLLQLWGRPAEVSHPRVAIDELKSERIWQFALEDLRKYRATLTGH
ncbi:MAG: SDR family NAD(P)-dependent oxidoreductase [Micrococcales bacterium]